MHDKKYCLVLFGLNEASWGGSALRSNSLPFCILFLAKKGTYFVYLLLTNGAPFPYLV